jgi:hypothetical protein
MLMSANCQDCADQCGGCTENANGSLPNPKEKLRRVPQFEKECQRRSEREAKRRLCEREPFLDWSSSNTSR